MLEMNIPQSTVIQASEPFALKFNDVAKIRIIEDGTKLLIAKNPDFPRPFKLSDGEKAHNYFDYMEVFNWYEIQKNNRSSVSNKNKVVYIGTFR